MTKTFSIASYIADRKNLMDGELIRFLPEENVHDPLVSAMRYAVLAPGKRIRPILMLAVADLLGSPLRRVMSAACAIELLHTFTLIHDDLPAMDNDDFRRGIPTVHRKFGEATAILAGDALQALAFEILARESVDGAPASSILSVISEVGDAIGFRGVAGGQQLDLAPPVSSNPTELIREIHAKKTTALFRVALRASAILCDASALDLAKLTRFGEHFGYVFQIRDDILDAADAPTRAELPAAIGLSGARQELHKEVVRARDSISSYGRKVGDLLQLLDYFTEGV